MFLLKFRKAARELLSKKLFNLACDWTMVAFTEIDLGFLRWHEMLAI
jgi:hypothetical protein